MDKGAQHGRRRRALTSRSASRVRSPSLLVLRHENQVLRRQLSGRVRWDNAGRLWLAALSHLMSRR
jgi:hypothetical protein